METYTYIPTAVVFNVKSKTGIVTEIRKGSIFFVDQTNKEYMKGYSNRSSLLGEAIRFDNEKNFVDDLIKIGHIKSGNTLKKVSNTRKSLKSKKK